MLERYDRQNRIEKWNQESLEKATLTIIGNNEFSRILAVSSASLGVGKIRIIKSPFDESKLSAFNLKFRQKNKSDLDSLVNKINPLVDLEIYETPNIVMPENYFLQKSRVIVDASQRYNSIGLSALYAIENKLPFEIIRFYNSLESESLIADSFIGVNHFDDSPEKLEKYRARKSESLDPIMATMTAGLVLEEIKKYLMGDDDFERIKFNYEFGIKKTADFCDAKVLVVGAGALGNFVVSELAMLGIVRMDVYDPDVIEMVNLNRQIFFYDSVGEKKAEVLVKRAGKMADKPTMYSGFAVKFTEKCPLQGYDVVFDCVDNFETRLKLSERCSKEEIPLISGGTNYHSGQVVVQVPKKTMCLKHALNLEKVVEERKKEQDLQPQGCLHQPDPSVIMSNQVTASLMVHSMRQVVFPEIYGEPLNGVVKYDSGSPYRFGKVEFADICGD